MAQKPFEPTDEQRHMVTMMTIAGIQRDVVAKCIINPDTEKPIDQKTLKKHFSHELERGDAEANSEVVAALFRSATGAPSKEQVTAAIFWTKTRLGWRETRRVEFDGDVRTTGTIEVPGEMTPESWEQVAGQYDALGPPPMELEEDPDDDDLDIED